MNKIKTMEQVDKYMNMSYGDRMTSLKDAEPEIRAIVLQKTKEGQKIENKRILKEYWDNLKPFKVEEDIPNLPNPIEQYQVDKLIECGSIPKDEVQIGVYYYGKCRNSDVAMWDGQEFQYMRYKFGWRQDKINHFEDDNGYDLFVPIRIEDDPKEEKQIK